MRAASASEAAGALLAAGAGHVLVTDGPRAACEGRQGQGLLTASPPQVQVLRVTGAGDRFMAAHIVAERAGQPREAALTAALAAAAAHVSGKDGP